MAYSFLYSLARIAVKHIGDGLTAGFVPLGSIAVDVYDDWCKNAGVAPTAGAAPPPVAQVQMRAEFEKIAQDGRAYRQQIETALAEMTQNEDVRRRALAYLNQVPGRIQASMRRPDDPTGRTVPPNFALRKAADLQQFLPDRMPRFQPGDRAVPGTDLIVEELIGVGGFGEVWKAIHKSRPHAAPVALKFCTDEAAARSLRKEVELLDRVATQGRHKSIVELKYAHLEGDTPCLEYEYVDGGDLAGLIADLHKANRAQPMQMARLLYAVALPVGFAHRLKPPIVHRDLKPQNILTTKIEGKLYCKVLDFGIGGIASEQAIQEYNGETRATAGGNITQSAGSCTPLYASPQQRRLGPPDPRDDVYALGVIWYQMLTGDVTKEPPRGGSWKKRFLEQGATAEMIALLECCIEDDARERPADAQALVEELGRIINGAPAAAKPVAPSAVKPAAPAASAPPVLPVEQWHYTHDGKQGGPLKLEELRQLATSGGLSAKDMVWTARLGQWVEAGTIKGLCPELPPAPPPPPPSRGTVARVKFVIPPSGGGVADIAHTAAKAYIKIASYGLLGGKLFGAESFKFYITSRLIGEGPLKEGFDFTTELPPGNHPIEIAHWKGNKEIDRKAFDIHCAKPGDYEIRFNYVRGTLGGMSGSTIEVLKDPAFPPTASRR